MTGKATLETERLTLRPPRPADAASLFGFMGDAEAMRFTHVQTSLDDMRAYLAAHEAQRQHVGCAPWVLTQKVGGALVGFGGLYEDPFDPGWGVEVAYFLAPVAWGRGYATELSRFCIAEACRLGKWPRLVAFAHPQNAASQRVLLKVGFSEERFVPEMNRSLYGLDLTNRATRHAD
jgi:[ribosomal protein S5]-alanine N-acetyltransferase